MEQLPSGNLRNYNHEIVRRLIGGEAFELTVRRYPVGILTLHKMSAEEWEAIQQGPAPAAAPTSGPRKAAAGGKAVMTRQQALDALARVHEAIAAGLL